MTGAARAGEPADTVADIGTLADLGSVDVVVVGGGVIGLVSAWRLAQRGASVVVVDPAPGSGATGGG